MATIRSEAEWTLLGLAGLQRGDILIKKAFCPKGAVEKAIVTLQGTQGRFDRGHQSSEHSAVCIGPLFVAEAEEAGVVANSLATRDRATTKYVVYRHRDQGVRSLAADIAESVARGKLRTRYTRATRVMGGGYKILQAGASLANGPGQLPVTAQVTTWPDYVLNLVRYYTDDTYNVRDWAFCSMFTCGCFEAAALLRENLAGALRVNPSMVSPREYEHRLETHPSYEQVGRYIYEQDIGHHGRHVTLLQKIKQAVEDYHKTWSGGGLLGGQSLKARLGLRNVSANSERAYNDLARQIVRCEGLGRAPYEFDHEVELLYVCVLYFINAPQAKIAQIGFGELFQQAIDAAWGTAQFKRILQHIVGGIGLGAPLDRGSTFAKKLTDFNDELVKRVNDSRRNNRMATRLP